MIKNEYFGFILYFIIVLYLYCELRFSNQQTVKNLRLFLFQVEGNMVIYEVELEERYTKTLTNTSPFRWVFLFVDLLVCSNKQGSMCLGISVSRFSVNTRRLI